MRFDSYHPAINLIYFIVTIGCTIWFRHPVYALTSYVCAFLYSVKLSGLKALIFNIVLVPLAGAYALWYAFYNHFGITALRKNFIGNQITLEALAYGAVQGIVIAACLMWIGCLFVLFTTDKIVYLLGRVSPTLSLFVSILLRMIPRVRQYGRRINIAQRGIGRGTGDGNMLRRLINTIRLLSILITWFLESLVESAASMKSRGYGLKGRTAFSIYRFDNRDRSLVIAFFTCIACILGAVLLDQTQIRYAPRIIMHPVTLLSVVFYIAYAVFLLLPLILQTAGEIHFARLIERGEAAA